MPGDDGGGGGGGAPPHGAGYVPNQNPNLYGYNLNTLDVEQLGTLLAEYSSSIWKQNPQPASGQNLLATSDPNFQSWKATQQTQVIDPWTGSGGQMSNSAQVICNSTQGVLAYYYFLSV